MKIATVMLLGMFLALAFIHLSVKNVLAVCGSFFPTQPLGQQCVDATSYSTIDPSVQCVTQNPNVCCSTQQECDDVFGDGDGDDDADADDDTPPPYPESDSDCGTWEFDPGYQQTFCFGLGGNGVITSPVQCPFQGECCRSADLCTRYFGCVYDENGIPTGSCEERYTGGDLSTDINSCLQSCQPPPQTPGEDTASRVSVGCGPRGSERPGYVNTAIGCMPFTIISETARFFLAWGLSIGGGVALLLIGIAAIMFATSAGNPEKVKGARELFWAAITGLGMLLLSVFLLRFIGVDVLGLFA